ncbi:MAG TPA: glycosyltransferase family 8 protein [Firmicutes bacterium]|nr:glycosyltransferase family 8 protein [Bacillota bacterium]
MNLLVTLDSNYLKPLKVMLYSLFSNNAEEQFSIYLLHSSIKPEEISDLECFINQHGHRLVVLTVAENDFADAPVVKHYTKEMYYRLLAFKYLPAEMDKILYLDPDILIINSIKKLYDLDLSGWMYAAAYHDRLLVTDLNKIRFTEYEIDEYYNSGVLLMNLAQQRELIKEEEIFSFVEKNKNRLILPDQDILNSLYAKHIMKLDEIEFNYDTRFYKYSRVLSKGEVDMDYIMRHTVVLHFCGKKKPWHKNYSGEFHALYKHYEKRALLTEWVI